MGRRHLRAVASPADDIDAELLEHVARGDEQAFARLYDRFAPRVYGLTLQVVRNPQLAEEVTQQVLLEVWQRAARFDAQAGSAAGWILRTAHWRAVDRVRSEQASRDRTSEHGAAAVDPPYDDVSEQAILNDEHARVRAHLDALTDLQREAIELAYFGGRTYREVAALLGVPEGTIKTRIRDGFIRLRAALGGDR